ncbi:spliceosome-associated protein CWC27 homolog isoform X2 [Periplaneta americana]|uniref:spliceosome-associated protein CWC27 homolog isoform X2 n=1 Tax=Periplaneta americana TaxID=6978 RepID=UPI0037E7A92D
MSNIYIQEPPTNGKVLLKTTVGDIDLELWSKETPKACRNFVQLCMEGYYNGTIFHRVVKGFIIQGGDPTGTGTGGESIYEQPFKDEFHSRLRFNRRGLLAMANGGRDDNSSQFFFTLAAAPELQNKHTIFGKVTGETIFNMLKLEDALVDKDEKPLYPQKIIKAEILYNPFPDIVPRVQPEIAENKVGKTKKEKRTGVKNFKLLSFGEEAEEDEEETTEANRKYSGRSKSTHDILNDPQLSAVPAVETDDDIHHHKRKGTSDESDQSVSDTVSHEDRAELSRIRKKLKTYKDTNFRPSPEKKLEETGEALEDEKSTEKTKNIERIRKEIEDVTRAIKSSKKKEKEEALDRSIQQKNEVTKNDTLEEYRKEQEKYKRLKSQMPTKGTSREDYTLALLAKFQERLVSARVKAEEKQESEEAQTSDSVEDKVEDDDDNAWLTHKLRFDANVPVLAKDASTKSDDWFEIYDPRNPINKRRREASKDLMKTREKR